MGGSIRQPEGAGENAGRYPRGVLNKCFEIAADLKSGTARNQPNLEGLLAWRKNNLAASADAAGDSVDRNKP
jgi:hypothetical protein